MARFQTRCRDDSRGPYRWADVVQTPDGLALASIYCTQGNNLTLEETFSLRRRRL